MKILGMIMAGGEGSRLFPLTKDRAKPAVPFGGKYRLIDFVLSNFINSRIFSLYVLTQFKSQSLTEHLQEGWRFSSILPDHFILPVPAQKRTGESWYQGTADAIHQNANLFQGRGYDLIAIFGADHIYRMDIQQMVDSHMENMADVTISAIPMPLDEAHSFGVIQVDTSDRVVGFQEKPEKPKTVPRRPKEIYASMGIYLFNRSTLLSELERDHKSPTSENDFGKNVIPQMLKNKKKVYEFSEKVAIKVMRYKELNIGVPYNILREFSILNTLNHINIIK